MHRVIIAGLAVFGLALAGMILGIVGFVLTCIEVIWWVFVVARTGSTSPGP